MTESILKSIVEGKEKVLEKYLKFLDSGEFSELNIHKDIGEEDMIYESFNSSSEYYNEYEDEFILDIEINYHSKHSKGLINFLEKLGCEIQENQYMMFDPEIISNIQENLIKNIFEKFNPKKFLDEIDEKFFKENEKAKNLLNSFLLENQILSSKDLNEKKELYEIIEIIYEYFMKNYEISEKSKKILRKIMQNINPRNEDMKEIIKNINAFLYKKF